jgi:adenylate cyclase
MPTETLSHTGLAAHAHRGHGRPRGAHASARPVPTFIFADLVGYTALTEERGDRAAAALVRSFHSLMHRISRAHGAWQVKSMGDGVMIWAPEPERAVALAAETVARVAEHDELPPVRVGVHTGQAVMSAGDWFGRAVNFAARLARHARPGEALISAATQAAARHELARRKAVACQVQIIDVDSPVSVWRLRHRVV